MKLSEGNIHFNSIANIPFSALFSEESMSDIIRNKGKGGQLLELAIGLANTNTNRDFDDGELKTNKCNSDGKPMETMAITQISSHIDELLANKPFEETWLYQKIVNMLYVPVCKEGKPQDWFFFPSIHVQLNTDKFKDIAAQLKEDYNYICSELKKAVESDSELHTINGKYLQIRTKDSAPYHPIITKTYNKVISDKNRAFYFQKSFMNDIKAVI